MRFKRSGSALGRFLSSYLLRPLSMSEVLAESDTGSLLTFLENRRFYLVVYKGKVYPFDKGFLSMPEIQGNERQAFPVITHIFLSDENLRSELKALDTQELKSIQDKHGRAQYICDVSTISK